MLRNEGDRLRRAVVCTPRQEYPRPSSLEEHNISELPNLGSAIQQHDILKSRLTEFGAEVIDTPELD